MEVTPYLSVYSTMLEHKDSQFVVDGGLQTRTHARTHARTYARTHARTHARSHARTHAHTHTHIPQVSLAMKPIITKLSYIRRRKLSNIRMGGGGGGVGSCKHIWGGQHIVFKNLGGAPPVPTPTCLKCCASFHRETHVY